MLVDMKHFLKQVEKNRRRGGGWGPLLRCTIYKGAQLDGARRTNGLQVKKTQHRGG